MIYGLRYAPNLVHDVYDQYMTYDWRTQHIVRVHQAYPMYHRWYMVLCMHQIWYTKYATCTGRMANVQWSIRPAQDVWLTYKAYSPCTPSIPYVSSVIYGYTGRILHCTLAIRQVQVVFLVYQTWCTHKTIHYRWYKGYTWWARTIRWVRQPYVLYTSYASL